MVNKQKGQLFSPTKLSAHAYLRLKWKSNHYIELAVSEDHKRPPKLYTLHLLLSVVKCFLIVILTKNP